MIPDFFEDKEIFITGGSGVVGTSLIEQLLRSCNVRKIYMLMRPKKNMNVEQRLAEVKEGKIFRRLKNEKPRELDEKLVAVAGDAMLPMLGITAESEKVLRNVAIVYHCAATVRFDEPLRVALKLNLGSTLEALKLAETLKKLQIFMHVSTFYSNPYLTKVEPKFYEAPMDWKFCLSLLERPEVGEVELEAIARKLMVGFPNSYTFTKNLSESLVNDYKNKLPVCIYRPSIVFFALEDPEPGFAISQLGLMGLCVVVGSGLLKTIFIDNNTRLDLSPADVTVKNMLYYTDKAAQIYVTAAPKDIPVYITSSDVHCNLTLVEYLNISVQFGVWERAAFEKNLLLPSVHCTSNIYVYWILVIFLQLLPALLVDGILKLCGRRPVLLHIQRKILQTLYLMKPFMFNVYQSDGITDFAEINKHYKGTNFNVELFGKGTDLFVNVKSFSDMTLSVKTTLLNEDLSTLSRARNFFKIKRMLYNTLQFLLLYKVYGVFLAWLSNFYTEWRTNGVHCM